MREPSDLSIRARLFRGYGPLICSLVAIVTVAAVVPSRVQEMQTVLAEPGAEVAGLSVTNDAALDGGDTTIPADASVTDSTLPAVDAAAATGGTAGGGTPGAVSGRPGAAGAASGARPGGAPPGGAQAPGASGASACQGRPVEVPGDDYSPACVPWTNGTPNGGATSLGVTDKQITVTVRANSFVNSLLNLLADAAGSTELKEPASKTIETLNVLVEYFNTKYHFYGRDLKLVTFDGVGEATKELFGGGAGGAQADAVKVGQEIKAFADLSAVTIPYAEALRKQKVINIGAPYPSKQWLVENAPYSWTAQADCSTIATAASSYFLSRLAGRPAAFAGGDLRGRPRKLAVVAPDNASYAKCADQALQTVQAAGRADDVVANERYLLNFDQMQSSARSLAPKIVSSGATTVFCACDPVMLLFLTKQLSLQNWQPEWISTGVAYVDQDLVGQLMFQEQWQRAFGISFSGPTESLEASDAYRAFKSLRPQSRPSIAVDVIFYQLQLLAIGIQGAGPNLNPQTFAQGLFKFPATGGRAGAWAFGPDDFATADDAREIYWEPSVLSGQNQKTGAWIDTAPGSRFAIGRWPAGDPAVPAR